MRAAFTFGLLPFVISVSTASYQNGVRVSYRDYGAIALGIVAAVLGCCAIRPLRTERRSIGLAIGALALAAFQLLRGFGIA